LSKRTEAEYEAIIAEARKLGADAGNAGASWCYDGNTKPEWYAHVLKGIRDGDPAVYDMFRVPDLSGEFADTPTDRTLAADLDLDLDDDDDRLTLDDACDAYIEAASEAFWSDIERACILQTEGV